MSQDGYLKGMNKNVEEFSRYVLLLDRQTEKRVARSKFLTYFLSEIWGNSVFYSGSRSEGMPCAQSDTDIMFEAQGVYVNAKSRESSQSENISHLFMDPTDVHPGYSKLVFKDNDDVTDFSEFAKYGNGLRSLCVPRSNFISNTLILEYWHSRLAKIIPEDGKQKDKRFHGPCVLITYTTMARQVDVDVAISFGSEWPVAAEEWLYRNRKYGWPAEHLIDKIKTLGTNLVPVGHASSPNKELEWRLSFSKAEKQLAWSFNPTQRICTSVMKAFFISRITTKFPDLFPTYFIKTAMFWLLEETRGDFWKPENLLVCLTTLLKKLISFLCEKRIENYFIPADNMMDAKPVDKLDCLKHELMMYRCNCDDLWMKLIEMGMSDFDKNDIYHHHIDINCLSLSRFLIFTDIKEQEIEICLQRVDSAVMTLEKSRIFPGMCTLLIREIKIIETCLKLCTLSTAKNPIDLKEIEDKIRSGLNLNLSTGKLTFGTFLFYTKKYKATLKIMHEIEESFTSQVVHYSFWDRDKKPCDKDYDLLKPRPSLEVTMTNYISLDVIVLPCLSQMYPKPIQNILARENRVLFIHPLLYTKVLRFHCHLALQNYSDCQSAVNDMENYVTTKKDIMKSDSTSVYVVADCQRMLGCEAEADILVSNFREKLETKTD